MFLLLIFIYSSLHKFSVKHFFLPVVRLFYYYFNIGNSEKLLNLDFDPPASSFQT